MMPCDASSRKRFQRSPSLENLDEDLDCRLEQQQRSLLDLSLGKLQQEQVQPIEPCLLKSVLISNAVRALQHHMSSTPTTEVLLSGGSGEGEPPEEDTCNLPNSTSNNCHDKSTSFIANTFSSSTNCYMMASPAPHSPHKYPKLDSAVLTDSSPLNLVQPVVFDDGFVLPDTGSHSLVTDTHPLSMHKLSLSPTSTALIHSSSTSSSVGIVTIAEPSSSAGNTTPEGTTVIDHPNHTISCEDVTSEGTVDVEHGIESMDASLSPLDLKGIDPLLYDFDVRSPPMVEAKFVSAYPSCSAEATSSSAANITMSDSGTCCEKSATDDSSFLLEDLDHIVSLLIET